MRSKYAIVNGILSLLIFFINGLMAFITRKVMLPILGSEIVGLTAIFSDILVFLNLADMGISGSIGASIYKPIHNNEYSKVKGILLLFKKLYRICGYFFTVAALIVAIIMKFTFKDSHISGNNAELYFVLTAATTGLSYFFSYRLIILSTDQRMFKLKFVNTFFKTVAAAFKIYVLIRFKSFTMFLLTDFVLMFPYLAVMNVLIKRAYVKVESSTPMLKASDRHRIVRMVKGLFFHQIGGFAVFGTNNLFTAIFSGLTSAALLSNYLMVVTVLSGIISSVSTGFTASLGNLIASENAKKRYEVFKTIFFVTCCVVITGSVTFINSVQPFIGAWLGEKYLVGRSVIYLLAVNYLITSIRPATEQFKNAAGIFYEDRYVPIVEALINAAACILLGHAYGMVGVVGGNVVSTLLIVAWQKPYMTFKATSKKP